MDLQPLLLRRTFDEAVEVSARMDALAAPISAGQERHLDLGEVRGLRAMPFVVKRVLFEGLEGIDAIAGELLFRECHRTGDGLAGVGVFLGALALAILNVDYLVLCPSFLELTENAAVVAGIAVAVVLALPRNDGRQVRRVLGRYAPLVAGVVGDAEHADFAVAPRLRAGPLDALVQVLISRGELQFIKPGDQPAPRESTRTTT